MSMRITFSAAPGLYENSTVNVGRDGRVSFHPVSAEATECVDKGKASSFLIMSDSNRNELWLHNLPPRAATAMTEAFNQTKAAAEAVTAADVLAAE